MCLLHKIHGLPVDTLRWICDFISHKIQQVIVDGQQSSEANVASGVSQDSILGPNSSVKQKLPGNCVL